MKRAFTIFAVLLCGSLSHASRLLAQEARDPQKVAIELDRLIDAKLREAKIPASPLSDDATFLRRVSLDLSGRLPTPAQAADFLDSKDGQKRQRLVENLLKQPEFGKRFARYWTELLAKRNDMQNAFPGFFEKWLAEEFNQGKGWDHIVRELVLAKDNTPQTYFLMTNVERDISPSRTTSSVGALFLGQQLQCAECHRHPSNRAWKREDFWGLAAFFGRTKLENSKEKGKQGRMIVDVDVSPLEKGPKVDPKTPKDKRPVRNLLPAGTLEIPDANDNAIAVGLATAKYLEGDKAKLGDKGSYREPYAAWLTSPKNPYFARAAVNRLWAYFFARGFVNPLDAMEPDNAASHPEAIELLTKEFIASGFDYRHVIRCICSTQAYQRSSQAVKGNESDQNLFSHMPVRVVSGPHILELYEQVLGKYKGPQEKSSKGRKGAVPLDKQSTDVLVDTAGYDERPDEYTLGITQALRLMNRYLPERQQVFVAELVKSGQGQDEIVEQLYLKMYSRRPTATERAHIREFMQQQGEPARGYAGLVWVLLNSPEFMAIP